MLRLEITTPSSAASASSPEATAGENHPVSSGVRHFESAATPVFLGRDQSMDIVLDDPQVSRQHAVIISRGPHFVIQDVGGRNPVRVNQRPVVSHVLRRGDVISLGGTNIVFRGDEGETSADPEVIPTVVDARESMRRMCDPTKIVAGDDTASFSGLGLQNTRSQRNLRILQNFSEVIYNLQDRQKLLEAALQTVFDNLEVKRGIVGFFGPTGQLEISAERNRGRASQGMTYSRSIVERVRREAVAILFSDQPGDLGGAESMGDSKSVVRLNIKCAMCLPLFRAEQVCGVLYLDNRERSESFTQEDLYFANVLSYLISLAIEKEELYQRISDENIELKSILMQKNRLVGVSAQAKEVQRKIKRVAIFDTTVLITGESGTGKELVARAIHERSTRRGKPFVAVNCAAIPETLLESELFGYSPRSGIAGADPRGKAGKFELADGGTLFLDEIGDMSLSTQAKILRVLEERIVDRLGGTEGKHVDLRILAATNKVLSREVAAGRFREDLYYRLKVFQIDLVPLRDRREDILPMARHFLAMHQAEGREPIQLSPRACEMLLSYHWPGNARELKHCLEEAVLLSNRRTLYPENFPRDLRRADNPPPFGTLADVEAQHIAQVLQCVNWNKRRAAELLGINRSTLYEKLRLYHIERTVESAGRADAAT
ncbi:MAG: sigma 54-interacting transcriptional regulator [Planctomycetes bacterium]|nr:sigma 54-interacting transcriptional regulator [Planctomycetota bacterium]